jgi:hypothetical protein
LLALLYKSETWSLTLRKEYGLRVFENRALGRIFGPMGEEVRGGWRELKNEELHNLHFLPDVITMRWTGHAAYMEETRNLYKVLVRKSEGKRPLTRPRHGLEVNIKMDLK